MRPLLAAICLPILASARDFPADDVASFDKAVHAAQPGDVIVLREGEWADVVLRFKGVGTADRPIMLRGALPGKTVITGRSQLKIGGEHLVVEGLHVRNPDPAAGDAVEFRVDSKLMAKHCRLTNCAITQDARAGEGRESRWVGIYGEANRLDHCLVQGKTNKGATVVVWLGDGQSAGHIIEDNYFGPREKLGKNGGETIRVGDSATSMQVADCLVRHNLFTRCDGETECISNKSCGNVYRDNTFIEVSGTLTLRHGNGCIVENNAFFGNDAKGTGGIRIIGEEHRVVGNYLERLAGDDARSAITIMLGIPDSPAYGYFQVKRAHVENNTIVDCEHPILIGQEGSTAERKPSLPPVDSLFIGNVVDAPNASVVEARCDLSGIRWESNHFFGKALGVPVEKGILWDKPSAPKRPKPLDRADVGPDWWPR
jgi:poly(beta-D-mannuronate) lyase